MRYLKLLLLFTAAFVVASAVFAAGASREDVKKGCVMLGKAYARIAEDRDNGQPIIIAIVRVRDALQDHKISPYAAAQFLDAVAFTYVNPQLTPDEIARMTFLECVRVRLGEDLI